MLKSLPKNVEENKRCETLPPDEIWWINNRVRNTPLKDVFSLKLPHCGWRIASMKRLARRNAQSTIRKAQTDGSHLVLPPSDQIILSYPVRRSLFSRLSTSLSKYLLLSALNSLADHPRPPALHCWGLFLLFQLLLLLPYFVLSTPDSNLSQVPRSIILQSPSSTDFSAIA